MSDSWDDIADWWKSDIAADVAYENDVHPLLDELLPDPSGVVLDLGCGEGQGMRRVGGRVFGADLSLELLRANGADGEVVLLRAPDLAPFRSEAFDTVYSVYLLDLIADHVRFFDDCSRVTRQGGTLVVIINHPVYTAPGSAPLMDEEGEVLWRWGTYFEPGASEEPAGDRTVVFHHRSLGDIMSAAAAAGWALESLVERPLSEATVAEMPGYVGQESIPRLAGFRWRRASMAGS